MLTFRNTSILFATALVVFIIIGLPWYAYALLAFVFSLILFYGSYYVGSNFFMKVLCSGGRDEKKLALSFDDGPATAYTPQILDILRAEGVKATFFCIGRRIEGNEGLLKKLDEEGHLVGNHSFSHHFWFDLFSTRRMLNDLNLMNAAAASVFGKRLQLFRPPYGVTTPNMRAATQRGGYTTIGWNIRSLDTMSKDPVALKEKILSKLQPGSIVLLHDTSASTVQMLPALIREVKAKGYQFETIDKLLKIEAYA